MRLLLKQLLVALLLTSGVTLMTGCMTPQERSGHNPKPFNAPTDWERNPYRDRIQN